MIQELLNKGLKYSLANPTEFAKAYKEAFGENICSYCPGVIQEKFNKLLNTNAEKITLMNNRKWKMIPGKLIDTLMSSTGPQGQYTNKNITDEIAEQLIAKGYGKYFIKNNEEFIPEVEDVPVNDPIQEDPIEFEVFEKELAEEDPKKDSFDTYSYTRLVKYCQSNTEKFPKAEWENLNRKKLIEYVRSK